MPDVWRIAFETAATSEVTGAQDMLLGINTQVQNDMPFVLAALGLRDRNGEARKPDHDLFKQGARYAYGTAVSKVGARYDSRGDLIALLLGLRVHPRLGIAPHLQASTAQWANSIALVQLVCARAATLAARNSFGG